MASALKLRSAYMPRERVGLEPVRDWYGTFDIELQVGEASSFPPGAQLALWCTMLLEPTEQSNARVVERIAGHLVVEPVDRGELDTAAAADGGSLSRWTIWGVRSTFPARHANDGPERAYVILPSGDTIEVDVEPATTATATTVPGAVTRDDVRTAHSSSPPPPLVPFPTHLEADGSMRRQRIGLGDAPPPVLSEWATVCRLARRLGVDAFDSPDDPVLALHVTFDRSMATEAYRIEIGGTEASLVAGDGTGARHGLITLAQWASDGLPESAHIEDAPAMSVRVVHLDLARRWYEPAVVARLIDLAAWRKFSHVHLHLTDDEAWRFPVDGYPTLAEVGGTRGHGLPIPALCSSGPGPYGRSYTAEEIGGWVRQADELGVVLVPEVDVPGHCHAALVALPELRDPGDTSTAPSVQGYTRNVLIPGHPATAPFLESVFGALATLFPSSPCLHIGGDEVAHGGWDGSPIVARYAAQRGLATQREIETSFHRELIEVIRTTTGRDVAMWEEAALAGLEPAAYAVAWTSVDAAHRLASAGHDVVMTPGEAYYLDMAADREWSSPGSSWAGIVPFETTCEFDPTTKWDTSAPGRLLGVQACIWSEHITGLDVLDELTFPRLDAIAERGWTGHVHDGPESLRRRASALPRFVALPPRNSESLS